MADEVESEANAVGELVANGSVKPPKLGKKTSKTAGKKGGPTVSVAKPKCLTAVQKERIRIFEEIQKQQSEELQRTGGDPIKYAATHVNGTISLFQFYSMCQETHCFQLKMIL